MYAVCSSHVACLVSCKDGWAVLAGQHVTCDPGLSMKQNASTNHRTDSPADRARYLYNNSSRGATDAVQKGREETPARDSMALFRALERRRAGLTSPGSTADQLRASRLRWTNCSNHKLNLTIRMIQHLRQSIKKSHSMVTKLDHVLNFLTYCSSQPALLQESQTLPDPHFFWRGENRS